MEQFKILLPYWSQITLFLGVIGYFTNRILELKSKRKEVKFTLFEQQKSIAINLFINNYVVCENFFLQVSLEQIALKKITVKDLDEKELPIINNLKSSYYNLNLFLTETEIRRFKDLNDSIHTIRKALSDFYFSTGPKIAQDQNYEISNEYMSKVDSLISLGQQRLVQIGKEFRLAYN